MHITVDTIIGDILRRETDAAAFFREAAAFNARFATK